MTCTHRHTLFEKHGGKGNTRFDQTHARVVRHLDEDLAKVHPDTRRLLQLPAPQLAQSLAVLVPAPVKGNNLKIAPRMKFF